MSVHDGVNIYTHVASVCVCVQAHAGVSASSSKYFVNVNVIQNLKRQVYISSEPVSKENIFCR